MQFRKERAGLVQVFEEVRGRGDVMGEGVEVRVVGRLGVPFEGLLDEGVEVVELLLG